MCSLVILNLKEQAPYNVKYNRTAEVTETHVEIMQDIETETERPDHEDYGMHITVLMSHGATYGAYGMLYGTDLKPVKLLDIFDLLSSDNFKHMAGKPKVVIVLACRNGKHCSILSHKN
ncbi:hypothetical protein EB796_023342 [Bugula neritina]|uniref:Caspase family p20 domain-containing protein n=1 Tax=Bugula neritina TaxID=10212 RepID=A0A7J7IWQ7_BUGNE|nr:hypothetical protein EB796_023342 [Bugula neritina]